MNETYKVTISTAKESLSIKIQVSILLLKAYQSFDLSTKDNIINIKGFDNFLKNN